MDFKDFNGRESVIASVEVCPTLSALGDILESSESPRLESILIRNKMPDAAVSKVEIFEVKQRAE
jgi:hypothetical protein